MFGDTLSILRECQFFMTAIKMVRSNKEMIKKSFLPKKTEIRFFWWAKTIKDVKTFLYD